MRRRLALASNNAITNDPCALCRARTDPCGLDVFLAEGGPSVALVCDACTEREAPWLLVAQNAALEAYNQALLEEPPASDYDNPSPLTPHVCLTCGRAYTWSVGWGGASRDALTEAHQQHAVAGHAAAENPWRLNANKKWVDRRTGQVIGDD